MELNAAVSASPYDEHYDMALVYCYDKARNYCFSVSRFPHEDEIEIMVLDQINEKVDDLSITLDKKKLLVSIDRELAMRLDGHQEYLIHLKIDENDLPTLKAALKKIFEGKHGLKVIE